MKKLLILVPAILIFAGCAMQQQPTMGMRYALDGNGNLTQQQYLIPAPPPDNRLLETLAVVGLGLVGFYFVGEAFDIWDKDPAPALAQSNPTGLVASGGQTSWSTDFIQPVYQTVGSPAPAPIEE